MTRPEIVVYSRQYGIALEVSQIQFFNFILLSHDHMQSPGAQFGRRYKINLVLIIEIRERTGPALSNTSRYIGRSVSGNSHPTFELI